MKPTQPFATDRPENECVLEEFRRLILVFYRLRSDFLWEIWLWTHLKPEQIFHVMWIVRCMSCRLAWNTVLAIKINWNQTNYITRSLPEILRSWFRYVFQLIDFQTDDHSSQIGKRWLYSGDKLTTAILTNK